MRAPNHKIQLDPERPRGYDRARHEGCASSNWAPYWAAQEPEPTRPEPRTYPQARTAEDLGLAPDPIDDAPDAPSYDDAPMRDVTPDDIDVNIPTSALLDGFVGRRVAIGRSEVPALRDLCGAEGRVVGWRYDSIVESGVLFFVCLDSGARKGAGWYELVFLLPDLDERGALCAEGRRDA